MDFQGAAGTEQAALRARQQYHASLAGERCGGPEGPLVSPKSWQTERLLWGMKSRSRCEGGTAKKDRERPAGSRILDLLTDYSRQ
jgi:hypothetical protein